MKTLMNYLKLVSPMLLVIFILGGKPAKVKGQEPEKKEKKTYAIKIMKDKDGKKIVIDTTFAWVDDEGLEQKIMDLDLDDCKDGTIVMKVSEGHDGKGYVYCYSSGDDEGSKKAMAMAKMICVEKDGIWTITSDDDGDMKLVVKKKKDGDSEADIYIIKPASKKK